jgi:8-oxo-dGTP pyrophosphatase MutT (NUDIX family)
MGVSNPELCCTVIDTLAPKAKRLYISAMLTTLRNFVIHTWFRLIRPMTLGVRIIAANREGQICLVRHTYTSGWHLPGGGVERGETCIDAAIKEAREEAGLIIAVGDLRLVSIHSNFQNFPGDHVLVYTTHIWTQTATTTAHEIAEYGFYDPANLPIGTTPGTKRRLAEWAGASISPTW